MMKNVASLVPGIEQKKQLFTSAKLKWSNSTMLNM